MPIRRRGRGVVDFPKIENPRGEPLEMMIYSIPWESIPSRIQNSDCRNIDQLDYEEEKGKKILTNADRIIDFVDSKMILDALQVFTVIYVGSARFSLRGKCSHDGIA